MDITFEDIESITTSVWATMLDQELAPAPDATADIATVGLVELSGAFRGTIAVHLSEGMVRGAASQMFGVPARDVDDEMSRDAAAELTNMVGGNVKCLVEPPTQLGLPEVLSPDEARARLGGAADTQLAFVSPVGGVVIAIHQASAA